MWEITVHVTTDKTMNAWDQIKRSLEEKITPDAFRNWVARTTFRTTDADAIVVTTPDEATRCILESEYAEAVRAVILGLNFPIRCVRYEVGEEAPGQPGAPS